MLAVVEEVEVDSGVEVAMPEGPGVAITGGEGSFGDQEGVLGGCTGVVGGLAGAQEGVDKERTGVMETIVMPDAEAGAVVRGKVPCLTGSEGGGNGKEVGTETV